MLIVGTKCEYHPQTTIVEMDIHDAMSGTSKAPGCPDCHAGLYRPIVTHVFRDRRQDSQEATDADLVKLVA